MGAEPEPRTIAITPPVLDEAEGTTVPGGPTSKGRPSAPPVSARSRSDSEGAPAFHDAALGRNETTGPVEPPIDVLLREESSRATSFARSVALLSSLGIAAVLQMRVSGWQLATLLSTLTLLTAVSVWTWQRARSPDGYTLACRRIFGASGGLAAIVVPYCLGLFSPAPAFALLGISFLALGSDVLTAVLVPVVVAVSYAALAALVLAGALPDAGVMSVFAAPAGTRAWIVVAVPIAYLLTLWQARLGRRATVLAVKRAGVAMRGMLNRERQLEEANRDLDRLLSMGPDDVGAFTGVACGRYVLDKLVGRGAMGEVYSATDTRSGESAAVKLLLPGMATDPNLVLRFLREGEATSKLRAPNVVSVFEVGKATDGTPFIAMELLRGHDLGWHLRHRTRLPLDEVVGIAEQVADGLDAARVAGIVHRDLKPQNVFLAQQPRSSPIWKILDFGVSRLAGSTGTLTRDQIVGTPGYMSPEQAAGSESTHRSDVFSFGAMIYRALTGQAPFSGPDTPQILYQVVYRNPTRPSEVIPAIPPDVDLVLALALAKDKEDRFASALALAAALKAAAKNELSPSLRLHAQTVLAALPWGHRIREGAAPASLQSFTG